MFLEIHYCIASRSLPQALSSQQGLGPLMGKLILKDSFLFLYKKSNSENQVTFGKPV